MNTTDRKTVRQRVSEFFDSRKYVYATPGTDNHSANFYGDTTLCRLCRRDVAACIEVAFDGWNFDGETESGFDRLDAAVETVLDDLQYDKPID